MKKAWLLFISALITFVIFSVLPAQYQLFSFILPFVVLCITLTNSKDSFNFTLAIFLFLLLIFIPSNWMMFNANLDPFFAFQMTFEDAAGLVTTLILVGGPAVLIGFGIYSLIATNATAGVSALLKGLGVLAIGIAGLGMLDFCGLLPAWGQEIWDTISAVFNIVCGLFMSFVNIITALFQSIGAWFTTAATEADLVAAGRMSLGTFLWNRIAGIFEGLWNFIKDDIKDAVTSAFATSAADILADISLNALLDSTTYQQTLIGVARGYPLILAILCLIFAGAFKWNHHFQNDLDRISKRQDDEFKYTFRQKYDFGAFGQLLLTLVVSFFLYLLMNEGGYTDPTFFGVYLAIIISCTFAIILQLIPARADTWKNFIVGSFLGGFVIFMFTNLATSGRLDVLESNEITAIASKVFATLTTIFYTSPAETLLFQVVIPGFALLLIYKLFVGRTEDAFQARMEIEIKREVIELAKQRVKYQTLLDTHSKNKRAITKLKTDIFNAENSIEINKINKESKIKEVDIFKLMIRSPGAVVFTVLFVFVVPSFGFAWLHVAKSGMSFLDYFNFGPGFIIMSVGAWITFIAVRFGYNAALFCHSINNLFIILLVAGVI